jgi:putative DNA primase/helicase
MLPLTDLGNAKRWFERHGDDFLWVPEWGWLAWDGQRWNRGSAEALVKQSVYSTIEAIGAEAKAIADSGVRPGHENTPPGSIELEQEGGLDFFIRDRRDKLMGLYSDSVRAWGRTSEGAGHIACIDRLAQPWLTARPSDFDADPMLVNLANATMVLLPPREGYPASVQFRAPRRADKVTKLAAVAYDPKAKSPRYDRFLERVQPLPEMRGFLHAWGGYNLTGDISAQKMALFYGEGANGKSTWVDTVAFMLGDYSRSCGIETFIDQGRQRKGGDATPDLAALAGRRMVRTSEPEKGAKFSDGLIKAMTGGEPMNVRELNKEFYEMTVTFKVTCSANIKPTIGTDHGIKRRVRLIPWDEKIPEEEQDDSLVSKLKEEGSGILNHLIAGALHWLDHGLPEPEAVKQATREYQEENDPLARFVELCIMRSDGARVGSTSLFELFKAWQTWAGEIGATGRTWSQKYFTGQMKLKGFKTFQSSTIFWVGIETAKSVHDFIDADGRPIRDPDGAAAPPPHASPDYDDDVL